MTSRKKSKEHTAMPTLNPHDVQTAQAKLREILSLVGEDGLVDLVAESASAHLRDALLRLRSSDWWTVTLREAITTPTLYNTTLLCKLVDKAIPTPQSLRLDTESGFKLIIEHRYAAPSGAGSL